MAKYIQKIALGAGRERWLGWDIDGIGTEIPGLVSADGIAPELLSQMGVREFHPMDFEEFISLTQRTLDPNSGVLSDEDLAYRLDALLVSLDRFRMKGILDLPKLLFVELFGEKGVEDPRFSRRMNEWQDRGLLLFVGREDCFVKILRRLD
ncbi:MAG: hypothetical protein WBX15_13330 [Thermoanaerobaculia bacterium]